VTKSLTLITGASMGIGRELAREFASHGHDVILVARSTDKLNEVAKELTQKFGITAHVISKDLLAPHACEDLYQEIKNKNLNVEILVNNAGFGLYGEFSDTNLNTEQNMIALNITALVTLTKLFIQNVKSQSPKRILQIGSMAGFIPGALNAVYHATKSFVFSFSLAIANEYSKKNVHVSVLCPPYVLTNFQNTANIKNKRPIDFFTIPVEKLTTIAYQGLMSHKKIIIPGLLPKTFYFLIKFLPLTFVLKIGHFLQKAR